MDKLLWASDTIETLSQAWLPLLEFNARCFVLLCVCLLLLRIFTFSAANRRIYLALSLIAAVMIPLVSAQLSPLVITLESEVSRFPMERVPDLMLSMVNSVTANGFPAGESPAPAVGEVLFAATGLIYFCGVIFLLLRILWSNSVVALLAALAEPDYRGHWSGFRRYFQHHLWVRRHIDIRWSTAVRSPMTWGLFRPVILVPAKYESWPEEMVQHTLAHEMAHIKRCDWLVLQLARGLCALLWINPLAWVALAKLHQSAETAADDTAVVAGCNKSTYAESLLTIASRFCRAEGQGAMAMAASVPELRMRIQAILNPRTKHNPTSFPAVILALLIIGAALPMSSLQTQFLQETRLTRYEAVPDSASDFLPEQYRGLLENNFNGFTPEPATSELVPDLREFPGGGLENSDVAAGNEDDSSGKTPKAVITQTQINAREALKLATDSVMRQLSEQRLEQRRTENEIAGISRINQRDKALQQRLPIELEMASPEAHRQSAKSPPAQQNTAAPSTGENPFARFLMSVAQSTDSAAQDSVSYRPERLVTPRYPNRALRRGIEGEVKAAFDIDARGQVINMRIIEASPEGVFDQSVMRALSRSQYLPQRIEGEAVAVEGVTETYRFVLET